MVTQCTMCRTWFRVSHEQLHAAHGLVRCSECGTVFNALATLRDRIPAQEQPPEEARAPRDDVPPPPPAEPVQVADAAAAYASEGEDPLPLLGEPVMPVHRRRWPWMLAVAAGVLVLAAQLVNAGRRSLAGVPVIGPAVVAGYRVLGQKVSPAVTLARYRIAAASLDATPGQSGALTLRGLLHNAAAYPQPLPLIAVTLTDRYGDVVASRVLAPTEYGAGNVNALAANRSLPFHVKLADPGARAVGFSLTLCKRRAGSILCQTS